MIFQSTYNFGRISDNHSVSFPQDLRFFIALCSAVKKSSFSENNRLVPSCNDMGRRFSRIKVGNCCVIAGWTDDLTRIVTTILGRHRLNCPNRSVGVSKLFEVCDLNVNY